MTLEKLLQEADPETYRALLERRETIRRAAVEAVRKTRAEVAR